MAGRDAAPDDPARELGHGAHHLRDAGVRALDVLPGPAGAVAARAFGSLTMLALAPWLIVMRLECAAVALPCGRAATATMCLFYLSRELPRDRSRYRWHHAPAPTP